MLEEVVHTAPYREVSKTGPCYLAKLAVKSEFFWKSTLSLVMCVYALLEMLRLGDRRENAMDKIYYFVCKTDKYVRKLIAVLNQLEKDFNKSDLDWVRLVRTKKYAKLDKKDFDKTNEGDDDGDSDDDDDGGGQSDDDVSSTVSTDSEAEEGEFEASKKNHPESSSTIVSVLILTIAFVIII